MAWSDLPTENQLGTIYRIIRWDVPKDTAAAAIQWLAERATRQDVSEEMVRLKGLKEKRLLDTSTCFKSEIWEGFPYE